jgi:hypothetical protein
MEVSKHVNLPVTTLIGFGGLYNKTFTCVTSTPSLIFSGKDIKLLLECVILLRCSTRVDLGLACVCKTWVEVIEGG